MPGNNREPKAQTITNFPGFTKSFTSDDSERKWILVDAKGQRVGRLATQIADLLRGKHKPTFTRHDDVGDFVVVINAGEMVFHGNNKPEKKAYRYHSGWFGHLRSRTGKDMLENDPELLLWLAVRGMVPGEALKNRIMKKLKVYGGAEHPHKAQKPEPFKLAPAKN
ncbi:50S ribosomal protein L13 [Myxococcota bacterium]|nr:50S ribosomal protein L13 [Myxococcota bacterium]